MFGFLLDPISKMKGRFDDARKVRRWSQLRKMGMKLGKGVNLPFSTWIDTSHCFLISIGDNCGFGENCVILAHDAMPNEFIDATKIGLVTIHESCHFGTGTVILPGVEIGPRSIVGAGSVVTRDIPPDSVASGNPAKVVFSLEEYLARHREAMEKSPIFPFREYDIQYLNNVKIEEMKTKLENSIGYITGGYTAMVEDGECLVRTD